MDAIGICESTIASTSQLEATRATPQPSQAFDPSVYLIRTANGSPVPLRRDTPCDPRNDARSSALPSSVQFVSIGHPHSVLPIFSMPCLDRIDPKCSKTISEGGVLSTLVRDACFVISGNQLGGFLSIDKHGICVIPLNETCTLLKPGTYYWHSHSDIDEAHDLLPQQGATNISSENCKCKWKIVSKLEKYALPDLSKMRLHLPNWFEPEEKAGERHPNDTGLYAPTSFMQMVNRCTVAQWSEAHCDRAPLISESHNTWFGDNLGKHVDFWLPHSGNYILLSCHLHRIMVMDAAFLFYPRLGHWTTTFLHGRSLMDLDESPLFYHATPITPHRYLNAPNMFAFFAQQIISMVAARRRQSAPFQSELHYLETLSELSDTTTSFEGSSDDGTLEQNSKRQRISERKSFGEDVDDQELQDNDHQDCTSSIRD